MTNQLVLSRGAGSKMATSILAERPDLLESIHYHDQRMRMALEMRHGIATLPLGAVNEAGRARLWKAMHLVAQEEKCMWCGMTLRLENAELDRVISSKELYGYHAHTTVASCTSCNGARGRLAKEGYGMIAEYARVRNAARVPDKASREVAALVGQHRARIERQARMQMERWTG